MRLWPRTARDSAHRTTLIGRILYLRLLKDGVVRVSVFLEGEEVLVNGAGAPDHASEHGRSPRPEGRPSAAHQLTREIRAFETVPKDGSTDPTSAIHPPHATAASPFLSEGQAPNEVRVGVFGDLAKPPTPKIQHQSVKACQCQPAQRHGVKSRVC